MVKKAINTIDILAKLNLIMTEAAWARLHYSVG